jgi:hypothetical protein
MLIGACTVKYSELAIEQEVRVSLELIPIISCRTERHRITARKKLANRRFIIVSQYWGLVCLIYGGVEARIAQGLGVDQLTLAWEKLTIDWRFQPSFQGGIGNVVQTKSRQERIPSREERQGFGRQSR